MRDVKNTKNYFISQIFLSLILSYSWAVIDNVGDVFEIIYNYLDKTNKYITDK